MQQETELIARLPILFLPFLCLGFAHFYGRPWGILLPTFPPYQYRKRTESIFALLPYASQFHIHTQTLKKNSRLVYLFKEISDNNAERPKNTVSDRDSQPVKQLLHGHIQVIKTSFQPP